MDTTSLKPLMRRFLDSQSSDSLIQEQLEDHERRKKAAAQLLQLDRIPNLTREELGGVFQDTDAWYGVRGREQFWRRLFGEEDEQLSALRETLAELVRRGEVGLTASDFNELKGDMPGIGPAYLSEILALRFPDQYWLWNRQVRDFLEAQGINLKDELPWGKKGDQGEEYMLAGDHVQDLRRALGEEAGHPVDQLFTDLFIFWSNQQDVPVKPSESPESDRPSPIFPGFTEDTFAFMRELVANNTSEWMHKDDDANEKRYRRVLREPLRSLLKAVAPDVAEMDPTFETEVKFGKVLATIKKRWPDEEGPYYPYLWGAFYRAERSKQTDAQLFVIVHPERVDIGVGVGNNADDVLERFQGNLRAQPELFYNLVVPLLSEGIFIVTCQEYGEFGETVETLESPADIRRIGESEYAEISIKRRYEPDDGVLYTPDFAAELGEWFERLYPLYRFFVSDDIAGERDTLESIAEDESVEIDEEEPYTLARLCEDTYLDEAFWHEVESLMPDKKQLVFYGPPGTGKTWVAQRFAQYWVDSAPEPGGEVDVVQFHPSYAYEEFVEGIRPKSVEGPDGRQELSYPVKKGLFWNFCHAARSHPRRRYVLILDEINRGELPRILGELLYLLEYRGELVTLPYSGEPFNIPKNVFLLGTMNTADRSIALVDHALRRRFHFVQMKPEPDILRLYFEGYGNPEMAWTADLLEETNRQLGRDGIEWHLHIGHSHFMREELDDATLERVWKHSVMPTLEEYFYRQPERLKAYHLDALKAALGRE